MWRLWATRGLGTSFCSAKVALREKGSRARKGAGDAVHRLAAGHKVAQSSAVATASSPLQPPAPSALLAPTEEDYRALLLDLLLYRQDTLRPVLRALQQERERLASQAAELDAKVSGLVAVREEIRAILTEHQHSHARLIAAAVRDKAAAALAEEAPLSSDEDTDVTNSIEF